MVFHVLDIKLPPTPVVDIKKAAVKYKDDKLVTKVSQEAKKQESKDESKEITKAEVVIEEIENESSSVEKIDLAVEKEQVDVEKDTERHSNSDSDGDYAASEKSEKYSENSIAQCEISKNASEMSNAQSEISKIASEKLDVDYKPKAPVESDEIGIDKKISVEEPTLESEMISPKTDDSLEEATTDNAEVKESSPSISSSSSEWEFSESERKDVDNKQESPYIHIGLYYGGSRNMQLFCGQAYFEICTKGVKLDCQSF